MSGLIAGINMLWRLEMELGRDVALAVWCVLRSTDDRANIITVISGY